MLNLNPKSRADRGHIEHVKQSIDIKNAPSRRGIDNAHARASGVDDSDGAVKARIDPAVVA